MQVGGEGKGGKEMARKTAVFDGGKGRSGGLGEALVRALNGNLDSGAQSDLVPPALFLLTAAQAHCISNSTLVRFSASRTLSSSSHLRVPTIWVLLFCNHVGSPLHTYVTAILSSNHLRRVMDLSFTQIKADGKGFIGIYGIVFGQLLFVSIGKIKRRESKGK